MEYNIEQSQILLFNKYIKSNYKFLMLDILKSHWPSCLAAYVIITHIYFKVNLLEQKNMKLILYT